jgi:hypothetical protein
MYVRKKNRSGMISIQVIEKRDGKSVLVKTIGSSIDTDEINRLFGQGLLFIRQYAGQQILQFGDEQELVGEYFHALQSFHLAGPELLFIVIWISFIESKRS